MLLGFNFMDNVLISSSLIFFQSKYLKIKANSISPISLFPQCQWGNVKYMGNEAAITWLIILVPCHVVKSPQIVWRSGTRSWKIGCSSNELQRFDLNIGPQDSSHRNGPQGDMAYRAAPNFNKTQQNANSSRQQIRFRNTTMHLSHIPYDFEVFGTEICTFLLQKWCIVGFVTLVNWDILLYSNSGS